MKFREGIVADSARDHVRETLIQVFQVLGPEGSFEQVIFQALLDCDIEDEKIRVSDELATLITTKAVESFEYYKICRIVAWSYMRDHKDMPDCLHEFAARVMLLDHNRPRKPRGPSSSNYFLRDFWICQFVEDLKNRLEMQVYRNPTSQNVSACEIVSKAFGEADYNMVSYETVATVWNKRHKSGLQRQINEILRALDARAAIELGAEGMGK